MSANSKSMRLSILTGLVGFAGAAAIAPAVAVAQDCKLSVQAAPQILYGGQAARVNVFAHFPGPPDPNASYAFASAAFDVLATDLLWSFATDGLIVGSDVLGIEAGQDHQPQLDIYADPSNPYRAWGGVFKPQSDEPAMVEIKVDPTTFSVYPSKLTSSSVECDAEGGNDHIFVNPLSVGRWLAAPGQGTKLEIVDDVIVDGRIITGENWDSVSVGIVPTGTVTMFDSSSRVEFDTTPKTFTVSIQNDSAQRSLVTNIIVTFDAASGGGHIAGANFSFGDGSVRSVGYDAFIGGVFVASGDFDDGGDHQIPGLVVDALPHTIEASVGSGRLNLPAANTYCGLTMVYDQPIVATVRDSKGFPQVVTLDRIEVHGSQAAKWAQSTNNLKQLSLGAHVFEATGVEQMTVIPSQGD